jgi:hypothetical protein
VTSPAYTAADCARIASLLLADAKLTLLAACIDAGVAEHYEAIRKACQRVRKDTYASDDTVSRIAPILRAIDKQCEVLLQKAEELAGEGKSANLYTWWLGKKNRVEYGDVTRTEHTGEDGDAIKVSGMSSKTDAELIELMLKAKGTQGGGE